MHTLHGVVMAIAEGRKGRPRRGLDSEQATRLRALLAEHGQGAIPSESGTVRDWRGCCGEIRPMPNACCGGR